MQNNQLILLLGHLDRKEMTRFSEFAHSPYFNKHRDVQHLVAYLYQIYPDFSEKKCGREVVFQYLYPALPHDQPKLAIVFTYATRLLEQFFIQEQARNDGWLESKTLLSSFLRQHNMFSLLEKKWAGISGGVESRRDKNLSRSTQPTLVQSSEYFEKKYKEAVENDAVMNSLAKPGTQFLWEKQGWLDAFYLTEKLRDACEIFQRKKLLKTALPSNVLLAPLLNAVQDNLDHYSPYAPLMAYYYLYKLFSANDPLHYPTTLKKVHQLEQGLTQDELQNIYNYLQNYCIGQINLGNQVFLRELFNIYQSQLEKGLLLIDGFLPEWHFKNIVTTGLRLDEHAWVEQFLEGYKTRLPEEVADNAYSYNLAAYYYHLRQYDEVLRLLVKIEYTDLRYNLDAKSLLLRTYYDLEEEEALMALSEAFKQYLKRNRQLSDFQKKGYFNLLNFTKKAFALKASTGFTKSAKWDAELLKLKHEMAEAKTIFNQTWIESKVKELG